MSGITTIPAATSRTQTEAAPCYRQSGLSQPGAAYGRREDGSLLLWSTDAPLQGGPFAFSSFLARWAETRGALPAISERAGDAWRTLTWSELHRQVLSVASGLLAMGLSPARPLMILSGNSLEQAVLLLGAEYAGIPSAAVSPSYSLLSQDHQRVRGMHALVEPGAVFVQSSAPFSRALDALGVPAAAVIAVDSPQAGHTAWAALAGAAPTAARIADLQAAHASIDPVRDVARIFFTSGSTGEPKAVPIRYDNVAAMIGQYQYLHRAIADEPVVMLDWLPWHHIFGGMGNLGRVMTLGGSYYLDDGRPLPGQFARTVQNLRDVCPTFYATVPSAWALIAAELERDESFARSFFSRLRFVAYGGASLPRDVWERFQSAAVRTVGERIGFVAGFGSTETTGQGAIYTLPGGDLGNVGVPIPGVEIKLVPLDGGDDRYEVRLRGRPVFHGYHKRPDLTQAAFDEEGFYRMGDAVRLANPEDPLHGLRYAGRCVEDFKLANGTWVRTGSVRLGLVEHCAPLLADAVICGHDRNYVAALAWPNVAACQRLAPELAALPPEELVKHPTVIATLRDALRAQAASGASQQVRRLLLMAEPPSSEANEIADKGYINQAAARQRRTPLIDVLYAELPPAFVACSR